MIVTAVFSLVIGFIVLLRYVYTLVEPDSFGFNEDLGLFIFTLFTLIMFNVYFNVTYRKHIKKTIEETRVTAAPTSCPGRGYGGISYDTGAAAKFGAAASYDECCDTCTAANATCSHWTFAGGKCYQYAPLTPGSIAKLTPADAATYSGAVDGTRPKA